MGLFLRGGKCAKSVGKLKQFAKNRDRSRSTGFENYCWNTITAFRFRGVELEKGLTDFLCRELKRRHSEFGKREGMWLDSLVTQVGVGGKDWRKKICLG